jgi:predicted dehydrogenase
MRIGVIGAAGITERALIEPAREVEGVDVAAVAARDPKRAKAYAGQHGIPQVFPTYEALLEDSSLDAIYVPLANSLHARWAIAALDAGKHVLCEKPLASNADQAAEMVAAAERNDRLLVEAFHWRYHPVADRVLELSRRIGPLREISSRFSVSIDSNNVRYDLSLGGGALMDLGCYCVHMVRTVAGTEPRVLSAQAVEGPPGIDVSMDAALEFPGGLMGSISCSMVGTTSWPESMTLRAVGDHGTFEVLNPLMPQRGHRIRAQFDSGESIDESIDSASTYVHQLRAFVRMVAGEEKPLTGGADAIGNMTTIDDIYLAAGLGKRP